MNCSFVKADQSKCRGFAIHNSQFCFAHDPKSKRVHLRATQKGGLARSASSLAEPIDLTTSEGLERVLMDTINRVRRIKDDGSMDSKTAYSIGFLIEKLHTVHLKAYPEDRWQELEQREAALADRERHNEEQMKRFEDNPEELIKTFEEYAAATRRMAKRQQSRSYSQVI